MTSSKIDQDTKTDSIQESGASLGIEPEHNEDMTTTDSSAAESLETDQGHISRDAVDLDSETEGGDSVAETDELEDLHKQVNDLKEQYLRARAEVENIRKRSDVEMSNIRKFALEGFVRELLMVKDSLEMARNVDFRSKSADQDVLENMVEGITLTVKQLDAVFERFAIQEVLPELGEKLDPELHQAMGMEETGDFKANEICRVIQKGYSLNGRLLRPAMVMVASEVKDS